MAKDIPDGICCLVKISQNINQYVRTNLDKPHTFARKFQGMVKPYLDMSSSAHGEHESQNFAVLLLENAELPTSTFNKIVTQLITKSTNWREAPKHSTIFGPMYKFDELLTQCTETFNAFSEWESSNTLSLTTQSMQTNQLSTQAKALIEMTKRITEFASKTWTATNQQERMSLSIKPDDAVDAICDRKADEDIITLKNSAQQLNSSGIR